jgi:phage terminase large subunit-like protein
MASPPYLLTPVPAADIKRGDGKYVDRFIQDYCRVTKQSLGGDAGTLIKMRPWQHNITSMVYARRADGRFRHRQALIGLPRKNGKSAIASSLGIYGLVMGQPGAEVYSCAVDKDQARIVFGVAKRMVEADEELSGEIRVYRDMMEYTSTGSIYKVLSSEAPTKEGLNPTVIIYDELHAAPTDELYDVMTLSQGSREDPLFISITTAGVKTDQTGQDSICYRLFQHGQKIAKHETEDDSFFMAWWGAPDGADYKDPEVWKAANPGYDDLIDPEDFRSQVGRVSENTFRTKRLNQWVESTEAWLPQGAWNACRNDREFVPGNRGVVLGFDGSSSGDSTALVAVSIDSEPQVRVLGCWERPTIPDQAAHWKVPRGEVKDAIRKACKEYDVREVACDEYIWQDALEELKDERIPIEVFPQTLARMTPATTRFYDRVMVQKIGHDGDPGLARHIGNAVLKHDTRGQRIVKDHKGSPRKIDLAVAAVMALDRADWWLTQPLPGSITYKDPFGVERSQLISETGFVW